ncbi:helix-turn-helix domain-containing protein [Bavariicoccus seileri]|uniref:helix-turn-helix domain-containing protein n=1 Tax=Bavariicoccus seileri TaxID=549685 RepID=UPI003B82F2B1
MKNLDINDIITRYNSGQSITQIANVFNVSRKPITKIIKENGISIRNPNAKKSIPVRKIISLYESGMSVNALAKKFGVSRTVIKRRLEQSSVVMRGQTLANQIMMAKRTKQENIRNSSAAHDAIRGKPKSRQTLLKKANTVQKRALFRSRDEILISDELSKRGIPFVPQKAIDIYNIDIAVFDNIALEVYGGGWHGTGRHKSRFEKRSKKIFDSGFTIVVCWTGDKSGREFLPSRIVDYLVALNNILRSDPTSRCKHYVIGSDANPIGLGSSNLNYIT